MTQTLTRATDDSPGIVWTPELKEAFPDIDPQFKPFGERVLVQMRSPITRTKGGIIVTEESQSIQKYNTQVGLVLDMGECAYTAATNQGIKRFDKLQFALGDFVRTPLHGGDKWSCENESGQVAIFQFFKWYEIAGHVTGDPLAIKQYMGY